MAKGLLLVDYYNCFSSKCPSFYYKRKVLDIPCVKDIEKAVKNIVVVYT